MSLPQPCIAPTCSSPVPAGPGLVRGYRELSRSADTTLPALSVRYGRDRARSPTCHHSWWNPGLGRAPSRRYGRQADLLLDLIHGDRTRRTARGLHSRLASDSADVRALSNGLLPCCMPSPQGTPRARDKAAGSWRPAADVILGSTV